MNTLILILLLLLAGLTGFAAGFLYCAFVVFEILRRSGYRVNWDAQPVVVVPRG